MSNTNNTSFDELYRSSTHILQQRQFSIELLNLSNRQQKIDVNIEDALFAYKQVEENAPSAAHMLNFINKGIQTIKDAIARKHTVFSLSANSIHQLRELMIQNDVHVPSWMPETFRTPNNNQQFTHNFTYYFDWSTVGANLVPIHDKNAIEVIIKRLSQSTTAKKDAKTASPQKTGTLSEHPALAKMQGQLKSAAATAEGPQVLPLNAPAPQSTKLDAVVAVVATPSLTVVPQLSVAPSPILQVSETQLSPRVQLSLLASRQYLELYAKSIAERVPFTLAIDDLSELLRTKECHFTQQLLTMEPAQGGQISDNHVAIARLNNSKGFVTGNMVACSYKALSLKGELDASAFEQMMSALKTLRNSGLSPQQVQMMMQMTGNG